MRFPRAALAGQRFDRLTVQALSGVHPKRGTLWQCRCECGGERVVDANRLLAGAVRSCGCLNDEVRAGRLSAYRSEHPTLTIKHCHGRRGKKTATYNIWMGMRERCNNPNGHAWKYYGGAGVRVCERWEDFKNFLADMGERPPGLSIDRYPDPYGDYEPGNCRWATAFEQRHNRRART